MSKKVKMFLPVHQVNDSYQLNGQIVIQSTLPSAFKKQQLIKPNFSLNSDNDSETSQTEIVDLSSIDIDKRRINAKKSLDEAKLVIDKLINGETNKETKKKKIEIKTDKMNCEKVSDTITYVQGGQCTDTVEMEFKSKVVDYKFYYLWQACQ